MEKIFRKSLPKDMEEGVQEFFFSMSRNRSSLKISSRKKKPFQE